MSDPYTSTYTSLYPIGAHSYHGLLTLYYWDYVDTATQEILVAAPGSSYNMQAVGFRAGLSVPPPDGRWDAGQMYEAVFRPRHPDPRLALARARAVNTDLQAQAAARPVTYATGGTPAPPAAPREPSESDLALAAARALNARLQWQTAK